MVRHRAIMPQMGTMVDFDAMLAGMHQRGIKLVMDLVVNRTSDVCASITAGSTYRVWRLTATGPRSRTQRTVESC